MLEAVSRRAFLAMAGGLLLGAAGSRRAQQGQPEPLAGQGERGNLRDPAAAGTPRTPATARDNDEFIKAVEHRLRCTCGCNLDVYTCRTTDFSCRTSPSMHRDVLALQDQGLNAQGIVDAFVARYGEEVLMAPKPEGFNLAGYLVPGAVILIAGAALGVFIRRGRGAEGPRVVPPSSTEIAATPEESERLHRELAESER